MSGYLDFVRLGAALTVMYWHATFPKLGGGWIHVPDLGIDAVVVFFVLSGFMIQYVAEEKEHTLRDYSIARLSRLWSILLPALFITPVLDAIGLSLKSTVYLGWVPELVWDHPILRLMASAGFVNQIWFWSIVPMSNAPVWSLGFEFWYYALFGAIFYFSGWRRWAGVLLLSVFIGPKILLLAPCWIAGVFTYKLVRIINISQTRRPLAGLALLIGAPLIAFGCIARKLPHVLVSVERQVLGNNSLAALSNARDFIWFYILSFLTVASFIGFSLSEDLFKGIPNIARKATTFLAGSTLSIYLFHMPLLLLFAALFTRMRDGPYKSAVITTATLLIVVLLGQVIEPQRYNLRKFLNRLIRQPRKIMSPSAS